MNYNFHKIFKKLFKITHKKIYHEKLTTYYMYKEFIKFHEIQSPTKLATEPISLSKTVCKRTKKIYIHIFQGANEVFKKNKLVIKEE